MFLVLFLNSFCISFFYNECVFSFGRFLFGAKEAGYSLDLFWFLGPNSLAPCIVAHRARPQAEGSGNSRVTPMCVYLIMYDVSDPTKSTHMDSGGPKD